MEIDRSETAGLIGKKKKKWRPATYFLLCALMHRNKHHRLQPTRLSFLLFIRFLSFYRYFPAHKEEQPKKGRNCVQNPKCRYSVPADFGSSNFPVEPLEHLFPLEFAHKLNVYQAIDSSMYYNTKLLKVYKE